MRRMLLPWMVACLPAFLGTCPTSGAELRAESSSYAADADWDRFRGPNGAGVGPAFDFPLTWTEKDYRWRVALPGAGHSSPVIRGDRLIVTAADDQSGAVTLLCLATANGQTRWSRSFSEDTYKKNAKNSYAASTPCVDGEQVYLLLTTPKHYVVIAVDLADGREKWRTDLGPYESQHGFGTSPMGYRDLLIVTDEQDGPSSIVALDRGSGKIRWRTPRKTDKAAYATPCLFQPADGPPQLILVSSAHGIASLDPDTGKPNWDLPIFKARVVASPIIADGRILAQCGSGTGGHQFVAVLPAGPGLAEKPSVAYEVKGSLPYVPTSVAVGGRVFLWSDLGVVTCIDVGTGNVRWRERVGGSYYSSPICLGDRICNVSREGQFVALAAADTYKPLAKVDVGEPSHASLAWADRTLYIRTLSHVMALPAKK